MRANARIKERLSSDSSPFDPMARVYESKRLFFARPRTCRKAAGDGEEVH